MDSENARLRVRGNNLRYQIRFRSHFSITSHRFYQSDVMCFADGTCSRMLLYEVRIYAVVFIKFHFFFCF